MQNFIIQPFDALTSRALYAICQARESVFVVEQACAYQELDGLDTACLHLQLWHDLPLAADKSEQLAAYARIIPPNAHPRGMPAIGRVLTMPDFRGQGLGRALMQQAIAVCQRNYPKLPIYISAQTYLRKFYQGLGFVPHGERYLEDGIEHIDMLWDVNHVND